jgi:hypothetical protein
MRMLWFEVRMLWLLGIAAVVLGSFGALMEGLFVVLIVTFAAVGCFASCSLLILKHELHVISTFIIVGWGMLAVLGLGLSPLIDAGPYCLRTLAASPVSVTMVCRPR